MNLTKTNFLYIVNTSDEPNNVIFSHAKFAELAGFTPIFVFPFRDVKLNHDSYYKNYKTIRLNFIFKNSTHLEYFVSNLKLIFFTTKILLFEKKAKHILAIDLTGTIASLFLKLRGASIFTLVNDNFSARYEVSKFVYKALCFFEGFSYKALSTSCIFPDQCRYDLLGSPNLSSYHIVHNVLNDLDAPAYVGNKDEAVIVLICGWLVASRGLELVKEILSKTNENVKFLLVGSGDVDLIDQLVQSNRITYLGHISRQETLKIMSRVDVTFAFYNPNILINRYALPQKVFDAILVGAPLCLNSEVKMSDSLVKLGACFSAGYFDTLSASAFFNSLLKNKSLLLNISSQMNVYKNQMPTFRVVEKNAIKIYREFFTKL